MIRTTLGRTLGLAALALAVHAGAAAAQQLPPAQQVVDRYVQAIGGRDALARLSTRHVTADLAMPAMGMTMQMESFAARPNKSLTRMAMNGMSFLSGSDGQTAWANDPMNGPRLLGGDELKQAMDNANFDNNFDFSKVFTTMETLGERTVDGHACWNVRMVTASGTEEQNCFDKTSGLLIGSTASRKSPMGEIQVEAVMADYKPFDGVLMPSKITITQGGQQIVSTVKTVTHEALPDSVFALPAEVKALQH